jgi:hypothetical protein
MLVETRAGIGDADACSIKPLLAIVFKVLETPSNDCASRENT